MCVDQPIETRFSTRTYKQAPRTFRFFFLHVQLPFCLCDGEFWWSAGRAFSLLSSVADSCQYINVLKFRVSEVNNRQRHTQSSLVMGSLYHTFDRPNLSLMKQKCCFKKLKLIPCPPSVTQVTKQKTTNQKKIPLDSMKCAEGSD